MPRLAFRLDTERLEIRPLSREHITEFARYRNLDEVARYQDWQLPYTRDLAHELVDQCQSLGGPSPGHWVQLALEADRTLVGDVAVWLDDDAQFATIGYTLAPERQGSGYAVEAVEAIVEWLFLRRRVHRIAATLDPRNLASARVLERCGFVYVGTARGAAFVRGEWADDTRFSVLADEWRRWRGRPTGPAGSVELVAVTDANVRAVGELDRAFSQRELVAPVLVSLAQALVPPIRGGMPLEPWYRAIEADGELAGFVMLAEPHEGVPHPYLWRFLVDVRHQGRGIGRTAIDRIARERRRAGATHLAVSWVPDAVGSPARFYERLGFVPTGRVEHGEVEALLDLATLDGA
ncbi:MAG: GNAT family N-acetyltransferase [Ilumatobacter sp.]|uniref:GNAT family N-acetyltransferase n=1 Tax=Ilumatobacter sp. TaxID=1967498 RepID=UPI0026278A91|nr:GNAT family N-acetyltransferase [Ilumatobacter sp.]MDJ0769146.1 GNAT family N-acetyltransferase [Ilumatobacter sp.]